MKPLREVAEAYMALGDAERQLRDNSYEDAAASCRKAMEVSRTISKEEAFDHAGFDAFCYASLSLALGRLRKFDDCLQAADLALRYFNRRGELNQEDGKLWITAVFSRALALEALGRTSEALGEFRKAGEMLAERKGEMAGSDALRSEADERIAHLEGIVEPGKKAGYKAWWEFWS